MPEDNSRGYGQDGGEGERGLGVRQCVTWKTIIDSSRQTCFAWQWEESSRKEQVAS